MSSGAQLSNDRQYRYALWRWWDRTKPYALFIGLNPSTADENVDDPTIRRCIRFAKDWGYGGVYMVNLFALRATKPNDMLVHDDPVGAENDNWVEYLAINAGVIVCAWGRDGGYMGRDKQVKKLLDQYELKCLKLTKHGHPWHPLYVKGDIKLKVFK